MRFSPKTKIMRWKSHEKKTAKKFGGRTTLATGALAHDKGDVKSKHFRIECKQTEAESYVLKLAILEKIRKEAISDGKLPALALDIAGKRYYVIDENLMERLIEDANNDD